MEYTLADAAKVARLNKSTLFRAIKSGRLSARRLDDGSYRVDASELARVYDLQHLTRGDTDALQQDAPVREGPATAATPGPSEAELAVLRVKLEETEGKLAKEREEREQEREAWQRERSAIKLLENHLSESREDLQRRLEEERQERKATQQELREAHQKLMEKPQEPPAVVEELRKRLEEAEARIASLPAPEKPVERPVAAETAAPVAQRKGLLARLLGRG